MAIDKTNIGQYVAPTSKTPSDDNRQVRLLVGFDSQDNAVTINQEGEVMTEGAQFLRPVTPAEALRIAVEMCGDHRLIVAALERVFPEMETPTIP
jgi:hypothetical protein